MFDSPVEYVHVHIVLSSGNRVEARASIRRCAIHLARKLPKRVSLPGTSGKIVNASPEARVPQVRLGEHIIVSGFFDDSFCDQVVRVNDRIAPCFFFDAIDEDASLVKAHVLIKVSAFQIESD